MAREVFFDTSVFFAHMDGQDALHQRASDWLRTRSGKIKPLTTEWVLGETCTLLIARKRAHLVSLFLDYVERSTALILLNPDDALLRAAKTLIRKQADQGYSFVDCISFCVMAERRVGDVLTTDLHFRKAGFSPLLV